MKAQSKKRDLLAIFDAETRKIQIICVLLHLKFKNERNNESKNSNLV